MPEDRDISSQTEVYQINLRMLDEREVTTFEAEAGQGQTYRLAVSEGRISIPMAQSPVEGKFNRLASQWRKDTLLSSSITQDHMHPAHLGILAMGKPALPLILKELEQNGGHWFLALRLISDEDPVKPEHAGRIKLMREDWLAWGRLHGYL